MNRIVNISITEVISDSQQALTGKWGTIWGALIVYVLVSSVAGFIPFVSLIIEGPLSLGLAIIALSIVRRRDTSVSVLFDGFNNFASAVGVLLLTGIVVVVGFICFVIPGIILALGLSQVFNVLADNPNMSVVDVLKKSYEMMKGYKGTYFVLNLVFGLLAVATIITLGLGLIWLIPIMSIAHAKFYTLINDQENEGFSIEDNLIN